MTLECSTFLSPCARGGIDRSAHRLGPARASMALLAVFLALPFTGTAAAAAPDPVSKLQGSIRSLAATESPQYVDIEIEGRIDGALRNAVEALGGAVGQSYLDLLDASVPAQALERLASRLSVERIRKRIRPHA